MQTRQGSTMADADSSVAEAASTAAAKPRKRFFGYLKYAVLLIALLSLVGHWLWVPSGSGQWKLVKEEGGVTIWTMKAPGTGLLQVKGHIRVKARLASAISLQEDATNCADANCSEAIDSIAGVPAYFYDAKVIERIPSAPGRHAAYIAFKLDPPGMKPIEYVLLQQRSQDPVTKVVNLNLFAAPARIERDPCCVRVTYLHNRWRFTPHANGEIDIELIQDTDDGGIPYPIANLMTPELTHQLLLDMPRQLKMDRYRNAKVEQLVEAVPESSAG